MWKSYTWYHDEKTKPETRKLKVTAKSTIKASPDMAVLRFAINSTEKTAEKAHAANEVAAAIAELVSAISVNGSNEFNGIEYTVLNAKNKADQMLKNLNEVRGQILELEELSDTNIIYPRMEKMVMAASIPVADNSAYSSGEIEVEASVRAVFTARSSVE